MKYYATLEAEPERSRVSKKGSNSQLLITLYRGNKQIGLITYGGGEVGIELYDASEVYSVDEGTQFKVAGREVRFVLPKVLPVIKA